MLHYITISRSIVQSHCMYYYYYVFDFIIYYVFGFEEL